MCCHSKIVYATCGHSEFGSRPLIKCRKAPADVVVGIPRTGLSKGTKDSQPPWPHPEDMAAASMPRCEIFAHPLKTLRIERLCPRCEAGRDTLLRSQAGRSAVTELRWDRPQWRNNNDFRHFISQLAVLVENCRIWPGSKIEDKIGERGDSVVGVEAW